MSGGGFDVGCTSAKDARRAAGSRESSEKRVVDTLYLLPVFGVGGGGGGASSCAGGGAAALAFSRAVSEKFSRFNRATSLRKAASSLSSRRRIGDRTGVFVGFFTALRAAFAGRSGASGRGAFCAVWMMSAKGFATVARRSAICVFGLADKLQCLSGSGRPTQWQRRRTLLRRRRRGSLIWAHNCCRLVDATAARESQRWRITLVLCATAALELSIALSCTRQCKNARAQAKNIARPGKTLGKVVLRTCCPTGDK